MPIAPMIQQSTPCPGCGYDLRGLRLDGKCPECGRPTIDTFARNVASVDGHVVSEMLGISGRLLVFFAAAVGFAALARRVPLLMLELPTAHVGVLLTLLVASKSLLRVYAVIEIRGRFAVTGPVAASWPLWLGCVVGVVGIGCVGVAIAHDALPSVGALGVGSLLLAGCGLLAGSATSGLLKQASLRRAVPNGQYFLAGTALVFGLILTVPLPFLGLWDGLLVRVLIAFLAAVLWWMTWLRYQEALRVGLGPVTSL